MNKKAEMGLELTLVLIIGVLVTGFVIYGFSTNWVMFDGLFPKNNIGWLRSQCEYACSQGEIGKYDFCNHPRDVQIEGKVIPPMSCYELSKIVSGDYANLVEKCPEIKCETE